MLLLISSAVVTPLSIADSYYAHAEPYSNSTTELGSSNVYSSVNATTQAVNDPQLSPLEFNNYTSIETQSQNATQTITNSTITVPSNATQTITNSTITVPSNATQTITNSTITVPSNATQTITNSTFTNSTIQTPTQSWSFNSIVNGSQFVGDVQLNQTGITLDGGFIRSNGTQTANMTGLSITAWINPDYSNAASSMTIISKENAFELTLNNNLIPQRTAIFSVFDGIRWHQVQTITQIGENWSHIAATFNGTNIAIYTNGTISSTTKTTNTISLNDAGIIQQAVPEISNSESDVVIGATLDTRAIDAAENAFSGSIDQVQIYDKYLTAEQVMQIYIQTLPLILTKSIVNQTIPVILPPVNLLNNTNINGTLNTNATEIIIIPPQAVNQTKQMTVSAWIIPQYEKTSDELTVISKENSFALSVNNALDPRHTAKFTVFDGIRWTDLFGRNQINSLTLITAVVNNTQISLYINGTLHDSKEIPDSIIISDGALTLTPAEVANSGSEIIVGAYQSTLRGESQLTNKFSGTIQEPLIYPRALSDSEIKELYIVNLPQEITISLFESMEVFIDVQNLSSDVNGTIKFDEAFGLGDHVQITLNQASEQTKSTILIDERGKDYHKVEFTNGTGYVELGLPEWVYDNSTNKFVDSIATETNSDIVVDSMQIPFKFDKTDCSASIFEQGRMNKNLARIIDKYYWKVMESSDGSNWNESPVNNAICSVTKIENSTGLFINAVRENKHSQFITIFGKKVDQPLEVFLYYTNKDINATSTKIGFVSHMQGIDTDEIDLGDEQLATDTKVQEKKIKKQLKKLLNKNDKDDNLDTLKELKSSQKSTKLKASLSKEFAINREGKKSLLFDYSKAHKEFKQVHIENKNGKLETVVEFLDSAQVAEPGETIFLDPVFGFSTGTNILITTSGATGTSCPTPTTKQSAVGSPLLRIRQSTSATSPACSRIATEWNISTIPDDAIIQDTRMRFDISAVAGGGRSVDINSMELSPVTITSPGTIWTDIGNGTTFASNLLNSTTTGTDKTSDLGASADTDLQNNLVSDWWAVGIKANSETRDGTLHTSTFTGIELRVQYQRSASMTQNLGITDVLIKTTTKRLTENLGFTTAVLATKRKTLTENLGILDTITNNAIITVTKSVTENLGMTDTLTTTVSRTRSLTENLGVTDNVFASTSSFSKTLTENLGMESNAISASTKLKTLTESLGTTDITTTTSTKTQSLTENFGIRDNISTSPLISLTERLGITTTATASLTNKAIQENLGMTDQVSTRISKLSLTENLGIVDTRICEICLTQTQHAYVEQTTRQTSTSTSYVDISGATISSSSFTAGKKYLLVFTALVDGNNVNGNFGIQAVHGATAFTGSEMIVEPQTTTTRTTYHWFTVWTAESGQDVKLQFRTLIGTDTVGADQITMFALNLSDDLVEDQDWKYVTNTTPASLSTTFGSRASATITPSTPGEDWLVMGTATHTGFASGDDLNIRLARSGEATSSQPDFRQETEDLTNDIMLHSPFRVFNLGSASNTFTVESASVGGSSGTHQSSAIFLINLDKFKQDYSSYTEANLDLSATNYATEVQTLSATIACPADVWAMGTFATDMNTAGIYTKGRLQINNLDSPATQTTDSYQQGDSWVGTDELPLQYQAVANLSVGTHTIDLDASTEAATSGRSAEDRQLFVISLVPKNRLNLKALTENLGVTGTTTGTFSKSFTENLGITSQTDIAKKQSLTENLGMTSQAATTGVKLLTENLGMTDNTIRSSTRSITENLGVTDVSVASVSKYLISFTENLGITSATRNSATISLTENLGMTSQAATTGVKLLTENLGMTATAEQQRAVLLQENLGILDTMTVTRTQSLTENLGIVDTRICEICLTQTQHAYVEQTTRQTSTSTSYVDISGATISSSSFTAGKKYLLVLTAQVDGSDSNGNFGIQTVHGSTAFTGSEMVVEPQTTTTRTTYHWFTVWTAVASEDVKLQFRTLSGTHTVGADQITMFALNLSDDLVEDQDWKYVTNTTPASLSTTFGSRASTTIAPSITGEDWLVMGTATHTGIPVGRQIDIRLARSGEATSDQPEFIQDVEDQTNDVMLHSPFRVFNLGAASNTFTVESAVNTGTIGTHQSSAIFLINLDKFKQDYASYTEANLDRSATNYATEVQALSATIAWPADVWAMGTFATDMNTAGIYTKGRLQINNLDSPATQTTDSYQQGDSWAGTDELPLQYQAVANLSVDTHTIDLDASTEAATSGRSAEDRQLFVISLVPKNRLDLKALTENLGVLDNISNTITVSLTENLGVLDTVAPTRTQSRTENLGSLDTVATPRTQSLSDNLGMTDQVATT
ncbi:LamG domain-containing protein [Candidatus Nitrosotenuis cloacae]|nr:LamG domain-containing protein [Candidatus Nitrosotenuis cloacae]